ncbi:family 78 glycoside hydrolase catalytic domain [Leifsonia sp. NPDC056665]|uniref:family 78 glycoside hydrolase catalytic domain n=1 Tax=Leifsonia sp. NPDC056665 TaxID=3345901 RepID=UPI00368CBF66
MNDVARTNQAAPYDLVVETGGDTFPVSEARPELSWKVPQYVREQLGFELEATIGDEALSYASKGAQHRFITWPWRALASTEPVRWRVRVRHSGGMSPWSETAYFEAGLFEADWSGQWISAPGGAEASVGNRPAFDFSTRFELEGHAVRARLYVAALGVYEAFVNGVRVGTTELAPGTQSYDRTLYAQAIDVTDALRGENTLTIRLSDGWFRGRAGAFRKEALWGTETAIRAELHLDADGVTSVVARTSTGWSVFESPVRQADLMDGQVNDFLTPPRQLGLAVPSSELPPSISWSPAPPVRVVAELKPVSIAQVGDDDIVVDFGQNASGRVSLASLGEAGSKTTLEFGEHVGQDGKLTLKHLGTNAPDGEFVEFIQQDSVISDGSSSRFEPHHTVHGFQYAQIHREGLKLNEADIKMQVLHSDLREVGGFASSDTALNRLWDVAKWSFRGNAVDIPTDCPTRERAGWTGDYQIFLPTAVRLYDVDGFSRKWLQSVRDDQMDDGRIVNISPDNSRLRTIPDPGVDFATGSAGWGDAITIVPWELYKAYGDTAVLAESWEAMTRWVAFALKAAAENRHPSRVARSAEPQPHEKYVWDGTFHFGEWLEPTPIAEDGTPGSTMPDPIAWAMADKGEVGTAYLFRSVSVLAKAAQILGRDDDAAHYRDLAEKIRNAWQLEFINSDGRTPDDKQASYVRALAFDLVPEHVKTQAVERLVELIEAADVHLGTGFLSTADLLPVLADNGHADLAHQLLQQRTSPSWLGMIDRGATTIWEEWEGVDRNGNAHASLNHYSKGAVIRYLHSHILGLQANEDSIAWESFTVQPVIPEGMTWASGYFDSPQGRIDIAWELGDEDGALRVEVPGGSSATLVWGDQRVDVGPGTHKLRASRVSDTISI